MAILESLVLGTVIACSGADPAPTRTDFNNIRVVAEPNRLKVGSELSVKVSGLGEENLWIYLLKTDDIPRLSEAIEDGEFAVLGVVDGDDQGRFEAEYPITGTLPAREGQQRVAIDPGRWTIAIGKDGALSSYGEITIEATCDGC